MVFRLLFPQLIGEYKMKNIIFICSLVLVSKISLAQDSLYVMKTKGLTPTMASGTQTLVMGRVFTIQNDKIVPLVAEITAKGLSTPVFSDANGFYTVDITELTKSKKKIALHCKAASFHTQEYIVKEPFTNYYRTNFDLKQK
jgi:hypothetical protein